MHLYFLLQEIKGSTRFKHKGLQNVDQLEIMFEDIRNTGDDHWSACSGIAPSQETSLSCGNSLVNLDDEDDEDSDKELETPTSRERGKRNARAPKSEAKKPKTSTGRWLQDQMGKIVQMNERTTASCESIAKREDRSGYSIQDVMALVNECGAAQGSKEHFIATTLFTKRAERQMFMTITTPEARLNWLRMKHEWMTRNDVPK